MLATVFSQNNAGPDYPPGAIIPLHPMSQEIPSILASGLSDGPNLLSSECTLLGSFCTMRDVLYVL